MVISNEMRRLSKKWQTGNAWPQFLDWIEVRRIRGWAEQRVDFKFPIVAIVGENGSGKSTLLQAAACSYQAPNNGGRTWFPSEFFPETAWDSLRDVRISFGYRQSDVHAQGSVRKKTTRWLGHGQRPRRTIEYIDLSRLQPVATRVGYARIAKNRHVEESATDFSPDQLQRLSQIMGRDYDNAKMAKSSIDPNREIPVLSKLKQPYSGFHQGSGETTIAELLKSPLPKNGLVLIDEIESSLHPRAQRRLIRDLAQLTRTNECQVILTTHSPYVLEELPLEARIYILETGAGKKEIVNGVSPQFAMTKMDDESHPECELYVEDSRSAVWLREILSWHAKEVLVRCVITPFGAANLGVALGQMAAGKRFSRPTKVFLDGDQDESVGCLVLPGDDAPERVICAYLASKNWANLWARINRDVSLVADSFARAMTLQDHKDWIRSAANELMIGGDELWQAMCSEWAAETEKSSIQYLIDDVADALG